MICNENFQTFLKEEGIIYLPVNAYACQEVECALMKMCARAEKRGRVEREQRWLGSYYAKELESNWHPPFEIRKVNKRIGYGVFARAPLIQHTFISEYTGYVRKKRFLFLKSSDYCFGLSTPMGWRSFVIDAKKGGNLARYLNHGDNPNVEPIAIFYRGLIRILLRTLRPVRAGEQLTYDYGEEYWRKREDCVPN